jgi:hypothetical protein
LTEALCSLFVLVLPVEDRGALFACLPPTSLRRNETASASPPREFMQMIAPLEARAPRERIIGPQPGMAGWPNEAILGFAGGRKPAWTLGFSP